MIKLDLVQDPVSIQKDKQYTKSMDYNMLRKDAIAYTQSISGDQWTDYNLHDPGVTILEQFCFALTDLAYRTNLDIETLLFHQGKPEHVGKKNALFPAEETFSPGALTLMDYRVLLLDKFPAKLSNCWISKISNHKEGITGLYQVTLLLKSNFRPNEHEDIKHEISQFLGGHRNLGEDFEVIEILQPEKISLAADIEIFEDEIAEEVLANVLFELEHYFNPTLEFSTQEELEEQGFGLEDIYNVPSHEHGFIGREQLKPKKQEFYVSKIADHILAVKGVRSLKNLKVWQANMPVYGDIIHVASDKYLTLGFFQPREEGSSFDGFSFSLYKGSVENSFQESTVMYILELKENKSNKDYQIKRKPKKWKVGPTNTDQLLGYESIQSSFPGIYGVGNFTPTKEDGSKRLAQSEQLKGYLLFFDQLMANHLAQLTKVVSLFSLHGSDDDVIRSYYSQNLLGKVPGAHDLLKKKVPPQSKLLQEISELEKLDRLDAILKLKVDHLKLDLKDQEIFVKQLSSRRIKKLAKMEAKKLTSGITYKNPLIGENLEEARKIRLQIDELKSKLKQKQDPAEKKHKSRLLKKFPALVKDLGVKVPSLKGRTKLTRITQGVLEKITSKFGEIQDRFKLLNEASKLFDPEEKKTIGSLFKELTSHYELLLSIITEVEQDEADQAFLDALEQVKNLAETLYAKIQSNYDEILKKDEPLSSERIQEIEADVTLLEEQFTEELNSIETLLVPELLEEEHLMDLKDRDLDSLMDGFDHSLERKNRVLSHLLARFGERFTTDFHLKFNSLVQGEHQEVVERKLIQLKSSFLENITRLNRYRGKGINYRNAKGHTTPTALQEKLSVLLNLEHKAGERLVKTKRLEKVKTRKLSSKDVGLVDSVLGEAKDTSENSTPNKVKFLVNSSYYYKYVFKYGLKKSNYQVTYDPANKEYLLYFVPPTGESPTILKKLNTKAEALKIIDQTVESLKQLNAASEGFHLVEHILLRPHSDSSAFFHIKSKEHSIHFVSVDVAPDDVQESKARDTLLLACFGNNYKILTNKSKRHVVYIKDAVGKEVAKSRQSFETKELANDHINSCVAYFDHQRHSPEFEQLFELESKRKYFFELTGEKGQTIFETSNAYELQKLDKSAMALVKLATNKVNYKVLEAEGHYVIILVNNGKELARSVQQFDQMVEAEQFIDRCAPFFAEHYSNKTYRSIIQYRGVGGRPARDINASVSIVYAAWTSRFSNLEFLQLFRHTLFNCAPAHISINLVGLNMKEMKEFEDYYFELMEKPDSMDQTREEELKTRLLDQLIAKKEPIP